MHKLFTIFIMAFALLAGKVSANSTIDLSGTWQVQLDPKDQGIQQKWYKRKLSHTITLPGSTDQASLGKKNGPETALNGRLTREYAYVGPAWYQREVDIPAEWIGKPIELFLERVHMASQLWVNEQFVGSANSISTAHRYDLSKVLKPGKNRLCLRITNKMDINLGHWSHSASDETMGNWNGAVGKLELRCYPDQYLSNLRVGSDLATKTIWIDGSINQHNATPSSGQLLAVIIDPENGNVIASKKSTIPLSSTNIPFRLEMKLPEQSKLWDEFTPNLYTIRIQFKGDQTYENEIPFGIRDISAQGHQFAINGRPTFMRGDLQCGAFPLTGYFSMDKSYWEKIIKTAKAYGLNHFRFHSYNPPHVAYEVADELGFYFCPEAPFWSRFKGNTPEAKYLVEESFRMIKEYGNHPSFVMMGLGNELGGDNPFLSSVMKDLKTADPRRLYNCDINEIGTGKRKEPIEEADFFVTRWTKGTTLRMLGNRFQSPVLKDGTKRDYSKGVEELTLPLISHELGQWVVHPSYEEIPKYTGVMKPYNLMYFHDLLQRNGMDSQAEAIGRASGQLAAQLYKEDMEICLRTPNMGGFQLLQLQDFPGQGDSFIGLLDAFWDSKGIIEPDEFRQGCCETVLLARFPSFVWSNSETFSAQIDVAHYGPKSFSSANLEWRLVDQPGNIVDRGILIAAQIPVGNVSTIGWIKSPLTGLTKATMLKLELILSGTTYKNSWPIWVYPKDQTVSVPNDILVAKTYNQSVKQHLNEGGTVLLSIPSGQKTDDIPRILQRGYCSVTWNFLWRNNRNFGDLGILCDPAHPAFSDFPTMNFASWQWSELLNKSCAFVLNELPDSHQPIVQSIDDFHRSWKMGTVFEGKAGKGKIIVTGIDLHSNMEERRVASQFRNSLLQYMQSPAFNPTQALDLDLLFEKSIATQNGIIFASSSVNETEEKGKKSNLEIIQGELDEFNKLKASSADAEGAAATFDLNWKSEWNMDGTKLPQEVQIDLKRIAPLNGILYKPSNREDHRVRKFDVYVKTDANASWGDPVLQHEQHESSAWFATLPFEKVVNARYMRFVIKDGFEESNVLGVSEFEPWFN